MHPGLGTVPELEETAGKKTSDSLENALSDNRRWGESVRLPDRKVLLRLTGTQ